MSSAHCEENALVQNSQAASIRSSSYCGPAPNKYLCPMATHADCCSTSFAAHSLINCFHCTGCEHAVEHQGSKSSCGTGSSSSFGASTSFMSNRSDCNLWRHCWAAARLNLSKMHWGVLIPTSAPAAYAQATKLLEAPVSVPLLAPLQLPKGFPLQSFSSDQARLCGAGKHKP